MRILAIFPYPAKTVVDRVLADEVPDTYLMGLNHLGPDVQVDFLDPHISRASDALWHVTRRSPISDRHFPANLIQQIRAIAEVEGYDALVMRDLKNVFVPALWRRLRSLETFTLLLNAIVDSVGRWHFALRSVLRGIDIVAYDTRAMLEVLSARVGINQDRLLYLPYGIDTSFFSPRNGVPSNGIISVGETNRDFTTLLGAVKRLDQQVKIFASRSLPLPGRAPFDLDHVPHDLASVSCVDEIKLRDEYARAKVVIVPLHSTRTASGVTSLLEGMSMGKPVIVARTAGILDYVEDGKTALTYSPEDAHDLARRIEYLIEDETAREKLGKEARKWVAGRFSTESEGWAIARLLDRIGAS